MLGRFGTRQPTRNDGEPSCLVLAHLTRLGFGATLALEAISL